MKTAGAFKRIIFGLLILLCFFLALELRQRIHHPHVGFHGMTNSLGFRSPELNPEKAPGTYRILFIGSSTTFGVSGPIEKTFPYLAGEFLKTAFPEKKIETINAAWPAKTSYWEVQRMKETLHLKPDRIVVMTGYNDTATIYHRTKVDERGQLILTSWYVRLHNFLINHSVFYVTLREKIAILLYGNPAFSFGRPFQKENENPEWFQYYPQHFRNHLEEMVRIASDHQIELVFIKPPLGTKRFTQLPVYRKAFTRLMEELTDVSKKYQIPLIDLDPVFSEPISGKYIGEDGLHFTDEGNLAIARTVSQFFLKQGMARRS